ncbi:helix-turn-helix domain-containing protein [Testudinibacter sp. TR-2022]|uniref:helix-turn-helix domain-containing protein n=1 Tax=Testudinibacter sp. TR-2022 TaxID=2585029 RepID=UPI0011192281|nr:helix-turn-helix transcriptional regulator [Testudinibacter sp. TR-2022]TNH05930.1 helix-turn-helix transcriptional regulator [Pasteurellaceae bacterium Phil11]TNH23257.1 helix-turn-helix transcriptional regulator [Testudinibacter sp. TR-2022]TNH29143.1 helix-turn-helix transcriptional regulator [Testudinibacter sp. TR-2022]
MNKLSLLSAYDVQQSVATYLRQKRKEKKLSRKALAERCLVPEATIKKFETTGQISLRQLLMIWQIVADLKPFHDLTKPAAKPMPKSIAEVLAND